MCHLAKVGRKDNRSHQWWDTWLWIDGSEQALRSIDEVSYDLPEGFDPPCEVGEPHQSFGSYSETDTPIDVRVKIRFRSGARKLVKHRVTLQGIGITPFTANSAAAAHP